MRRPWFVLACLAAACLAMAPPACGESRPRFTLRQTMFEVDRARLRLQGSLSANDLEGARASLASMEEWLRDPALGRYLEGDRFPGNRPRFDELMSGFEGALERLGSALGESDLDGARAEYASVDAACADCHAVYRPDLR